MTAGKHSDIVVLGGGAAGIAAAITAARQGLKVILVEKNAYLGGHATAAEVGTICGLYHFRKSGYAQYIAAGFAREFAEILRMRSGTEPLYNQSGLHYLPYNISVFKRTCFDLLSENGVDILFQAELVSIQREEECIKSICVCQYGESVQIQFKAVIDCSGVSVLSQMLNLPLIKSEKYQAAAQMFTLENITEVNEARLGIVLMKELRVAIAEKKLDCFFDRVYIVPGSLKNNKVSLKLGLPVPVTHTKDNLLELTTTAHSCVRRLAEYLIKQAPVFKRATLGHIAPQVGIRVGLRTLGKYVLTEQDVLLCRKFSDGIALGSWPIEEWEQDRRVKLRYFDEDDFYEIPARVLQSFIIDNLFMAGRCISACDAAIASARVIGTCLQTGEAAGCLAAASVKGLSPDLAVDTIRSHWLAYTPNS
jgi:glycine/D-amino acid oxidase-like deaminating enzyme